MGILLGWDSDVVQLNQIKTKTAPKWHNKRHANWVPDVTPSHLWANFASDYVRRVCVRFGLKQMPRNLPRSLTLLKLIKCLRLPANAARHFGSCWVFNCKTSQDLVSDSIPEAVVVYCFAHGTGLYRCEWDPFWGHTQCNRHKPKPEQRTAQTNLGFLVPSIVSLFFLRLPKIQLTYMPNHSRHERGTAIVGPRPFPGSAETAAKNVSAPFAFGPVCEPGSGGFRFWFLGFWY